MGLPAGQGAAGGRVSQQQVQPSHEQSVHSQEAQSQHEQSQLVQAQDSIMAMGRLVNRVGDRLIVYRR